MKRMNFFLLMGLCCLLASCVRSRVGAGFMTKQWSMEPFETIEISSYFKVELQRADSFSVRIELPENMERHLEVKSKEGKLFIDYNRWHFMKSRSFEITEVLITAPSFESIKLSGAVEMTLLDVFENSSVLLDLSGASCLRGAGVVTEEMDCNLEGACVVELPVQTLRMHMRTASSCKAVITPLTQGFIGDELSMLVSGACKVDLHQIPFRRVNVEQSGATHMSVYPIEEIHARSTGACVLRYVGTSPNLVKEFESSGVTSIKVM